MKTFLLLLFLLYSMTLAFGQTPDFDPSDVSVLKAIRANAISDSPLKTEWANESEIGSWAGIRWTDATPRKVKELELNEKKLVNCDVTKLDKLESISCYGNPQLTLLKVTGLKSLKSLNCFGCDNSFYCNNLAQLDLNGLINLETLSCSGNNLASLDMTGLQKLHFLYCNNNRLPFSSLKATLNLTLSPTSEIGSQKEIIKKIENVKVGDIIDFSSEADVYGTATVFIWYKNGKKIDGTDQTGKYRVVEFGTYYCTMTNAKFPGLILTTYPYFIFPAVVDNSQWFPPVRSQEVLDNCTHFSLIYYLKSAIWNKQFNRDPKLESNQFNHNFVWNQDSPPDAVAGDAGAGFLFMRSQGCATVADFAINEQSTEIKPDLSVREKALAYKSKRFFTGDFSSCARNPDLIAKRIASLKDSLLVGKCFTLGINSYSDFFDIKMENSVYSWHDGVHSCISRGHMFTIVGYNDTIKTAQGKGAFQVINSNKEVANGKFYYDYNWFYHDDWQSFQYCFLEEDFTSDPKLVMNLRLSDNIKTEDYENGNFIFTDTLVNQYDRRKEFEKYNINIGEFHDSLLESRDAKFDFENSISYLFYRNNVQIISFNNKRMPLRNNLIIWPQNYADGKYELVTDLTGECPIDKFRTLSVVVLDPISSTYLDKNDQIIYSYQREANAKIDQAYINFSGTDKKIIAKVTELVDTTITTDNFYSQMAGWHFKPMKINVYVKSCTSILKRKLITFLIEDLKTDLPPIFTQVPGNDLTVHSSETVSFTFKASDPENNPIVYTIINGFGAIIESNTGLFSYQVNQVGTFTFTVKASDGANEITKTFNVKVEPESVNNPPAFTPLPNGELLALQGETITHQFQASDPESSPIVYAITNGSGASINATTGLFSYKSNVDGNFPFSVSANDGSKTTTLNFTVKIKWNAPPSFTKLTDSPNLQVGDVFKFQFMANDPEKRQIFFSVENVVGATIISNTGELRYAASAVGTFVVKITVSDGFSSSTLPFTIFVKESQANQSPVFTQVPGGGLNAIPGALVTYQFKASDPENAAIVFAIVSGTGASLNSATGVFDYQTVNSGTFLFTVSASDGVNVVNSEFSIIVKLNNAPVFTSTPSDQILLSGNTFKYKFIVSDQEGDQVTFAIGEGAGAYINPNSGDFTFTGIPAGTFTFKINASDYYHVSTFTFKIKVEENIVDTPPVFTQVPNGDLVVVLGQIANFTFKASDTEGSVITYKIGGGLGASIDAVTGLFKYQPSQVGRVIYKIDASDGVNTVSTLVNIKTEAPDNTAPTFINPPGTLTAYTNKTFTYQFDAKDDDNDALTFSILNSLPEAQISSSGKLTFTSATVGNYPITVIASDGKASTTLSVSLKVEIQTYYHEIEIPDYSLKSYPNPFTCSITIEFTLTKRQMVKLGIFNSMGQLITEIANNEFEAGNHQIIFDNKALSAGHYVGRLQTTDGEKSFKLVKSSDRN